MTIETFTVCEYFDEFSDIEKFAHHVTKQVFISNITPEPDSLILKPPPAATYPSEYNDNAQRFWRVLVENLSSQNCDEAEYQKPITVPVTFFPLQRSEVMNGVRFVINNTLMDFPLPGRWMSREKLAELQEQINERNQARKIELPDVFKAGDNAHEKNVELKLAKKELQEIEAKKKLSKERQAIYDLFIDPNAWYDLEEIAHTVKRDYTNAYKMFRKLVSTWTAEDQALIKWDKNAKDGGKYVGKGRLRLPHRLACIVGFETCRVTRKRKIKEKSRT